MQQQRFDEARSAYEVALHIKQGSTYVRKALDQLEKETKKDPAGHAP